MDAASNYAAGDISKYSAFIEGYKVGNKDRLNSNGQLKPINDEYTFDRWWELYDYKVGRDKCIVKWHNRMTKAERKAATEHTPIYVASTPDKEYRKHPYTYLTQKCWKDYTPIVTAVEHADSVKFMEYFNKLYEYTDIPKLSEMGKSRTDMLDYIYTNYKADIMSVMDKVKESRHLNGEDGKGFRATFEWMFTPANFVKIKEGYYDE